MCKVVVLHFETSGYYYDSKASSQLFYIKTLGRGKNANPIPSQGEKKSAYKEDDDTTAATVIQEIDTADILLNLMSCLHFSLCAN